MQGVALHHVAIRTLDVAATTAFYADMLGLRSGPRPPFPGPGVWLYAADGTMPILHVVEVTAGAPGATALFDHFSFAGRGLSGYLAKVKDRGLPYSVIPVPETPYVQVQHRDPNGILIEVTFEGEQLPEEEVLWVTV